MILTEAKMETEPTEKTKDVPPSYPGLTHDHVTNIIRYSGLVLIFLHIFWQTYYRIPLLIL